jgi:lysozyme family protein
MADISKIVPIILKWEGGFSKKKNDKGGATNKGVTLKTYRSYFGASKTENDLKNISDKEWLYILKTGYWNPFKADDIQSQSVANMIVDWAWNSGVSGVAKRVQQVLGVKVDGLFGKVTIAAINSRDPKTLFDEIKQKRIARYYEIVAADKSQKEFLSGWLNRVNDLKYE